MATFNQQGQSVGYQFNGDTFHFDSVRSVPSAVSELEKLLAELDKARLAGHPHSDEVAQAKSKVAEAVATANSSSPKKSKISRYLNEAQHLIQNVASLSELAGAIANASTMVGRLFS